MELLHAAPQSIACVCDGWERAGMAAIQGTHTWAVNPTGAGESEELHCPRILVQIRRGWC